MRRLTISGILLAAILTGAYTLAPRPAATRELILESAPVDLPAHAAYQQGVLSAPALHVVAAGGWLHGFRVELVDAQGRAAPAGLLHHVKVLSRAERDLFQPIMLRLIGAGAETRTVELPGALGYPLRAGDTLLVSAMLHNPTSIAYAGLRVRVILQYSPRSSPPEPEVVYPFSAYVTPPDSNVYDLPPGFSKRSRLIQPAVGGRVIGLGGHLHRYGLRVMLEDVTTGTVLWKSEALRDTAGHVLEVPTRVFLWRGGLRLRSDHVYRITGEYFNPTADTLRNAGMAVIGGALQPDARARWPRLDHEHPLYQRDLAEELRGYRAHRGHQE